MCGIAGIIQLHPSRYGRPDIERMTDALAHRGPDGAGTWQSGSGQAWLGHRRLSIIDLSEAGHQPMVFLNRYTIIHNGEIYNYIELREILQKKGYRFRSRTDTEVIAAAYDCWGKSCLERFNGMFAFAIWDDDAQELFAARDRFGEKPFFYYAGEESLVFASEIKGLWAAGIRKIPNLQMLFNFLTIGYTGNPALPGETFFEHIQKLPAATCLLYKPGKNPQVVLEKYWDPDPLYKHRGINEKEALEQFESLLLRSVSRRLRSDVPVGTSLSGGLDSSSIAGLAAGLTGSPSSFKAFTAVFPGFEKDESVHAQETVKHFGLEPFTVTATAADLVRDWDKLCEHQEEPFGSASIYAQYKVFELAKKTGVKVLLDGQGADETLAGYMKYYKWFWQELFRRRRLHHSRELPAARALGVKERFTVKNMIAAFFPAFASVVIERQYLLRALRQEDLDREFVRLQSREAYYTPPEHFTLNGVLYFNTCVHGLEELLRYADRNAMAHGRETRLPFLDHELVEFVFSLPAEYKIRHGRTKWILREIMKNKLPEIITWRNDKVGFEPPQAAWMRDPQLQELVHEAKKKLVQNKILEPQVLQKPVIPRDSHEAGNIDWRYLAAAPFI